MSKTLSNVRTHRTPDGNIWHCAKDVYKELGITWSGSTLCNTAPSCRAMFPVETVKGNRNAVFLNQDEVDYLVKRNSLISKY